MSRFVAVVLLFLSAVTASAQRPLFDPDDFLDQRAAGGRPVFISRLVLGAGSNMNGDGFRPLGEHVGYLHLTNSFYWRGVQFDYKRSQMKAEDGQTAVWEFVPRKNESRPFQQIRGATPKSKDTLHAAWYWPVGGGGGIPVMLRSRVTFTTQSIKTEGIAAVFPATSGREHNFALDTDTWFRIAGHDMFGSLAVSETKITGTPDDHDERALTYTNRFPSLSLNKARIVIRPTLTVGGISNRRSSSVNLVSPAIEIFRPFVGTGANLHIVYSPQWAANNKKWETTHQVVFLIDRALFVKVF